jgi:hypothetical protein
MARLSGSNSRALCSHLLTWNTGATSGNPPTWAVGSLSNSDELRLREDVFERARGLKADGLLNLVEANQIWPSIVSLATCIPNIRDNWGQLRKVIRTASSGYLAWKFGVSPILSDLMSVHRYLPHMRDDMERWHKGEKYRYSASAPLSTNFGDGNDYIGNFGSVIIDRRQSFGQVISPPSVRYVLVVKPRVKYHTSLFASMDAFMSRFASSPASLAWEKIPFSFVVDWFVDLRGVLRKIDETLGFEPFEIVGCTRSLSYHLATRRNWWTGSPCGGTTLFDVDVGSVEYKHYERSLVSVGASKPTWTPRFGKNQAGISAALISQRLTASANRVARR